MQEWERDRAGIKGKGEGRERKGGRGEGGEDGRVRLASAPKSPVSACIHADQLRYAGMVLQ